MFKFFLTLKFLCILILTYNGEKIQLTKTPYLSNFKIWRNLSYIVYNLPKEITSKKSFYLGFNKKSSPIVVKIYISQKWNLFFKCFNSRVKSVWITPTLSLFIKLNGCLVKQGQSSLQRPQTGWSVYINLFCIIYTHMKIHIFRFFGKSWRLKNFHVGRNQNCNFKKSKKLFN